VSESTSAERWLPVVGWEGLYEVSNYGHVRSLDRYVPDSLGRVRHLLGCVLKPFIAGKGYLAVSLKFSGKRKTRYIHSLVLGAFVGICPPGQECLHGPNGRTNNHWPENLSYGTRTQNMQDKRRDGTNDRLNRTRCPRNHALVKPNLVPSRLPDRSCLACQRARSALGTLGWLREDFRTRKEEFKAFADLQYARVMNFYRRIGSDTA
jgi:hypothetical protein